MELLIEFILQANRKRDVFALTAHMDNLDVSPIGAYWRHAIRYLYFIRYRRSDAYKIKCTKSKPRVRMSVSEARGVERSNFISMN
jgi:hypothetical protein